MMYLVSVGRDKFYFTAAAWVCTLFFFVPKAKLELKGKNVDDLSKIFRSTIKTRARHSTRKKLWGREKKEENLSGVTLVIAVIIKTSALFLRIHVELCEFYVQKTYFGYIWEVFLFWAVVKANSRSKNIHYFFSTGSLVSMVYYKNTISTNKLNRLKFSGRLDYWEY